MRAGSALVLIQSTEHLIRTVMTLVLQKHSPLTLEKLQRQQRQERKRTLGYFVKELQKRVGLDQELEDVLESFLDERNVLVHGLTDVPGWSLESTEGREVAFQFLNRGGPHSLHNLAARIRCSRVVVDECCR